MCKPDVSDIRAPDLVGTLDNQIPQQIRIDGVIHSAPAGVGSRANPLNPHDAHEALNPFPIDLVLLPPEKNNHLPAPVKWCPGVLKIDQVHQDHVLRIRRKIPIIEARPTKSQDFALPGETEFFAHRVDEVPFVLQAQSPNFFLSQSFSTSTSPILP